MIGAADVNDRVWLVTGVAGFISLNLTAHLPARGGAVVGLNNLSIGSRENLAGFAERHSSKWMFIARRHLARWVIYASSSAVYGDAGPSYSPKQPPCQSDQPLRLDQGTTSTTRPPLPTRAYSPRAYVPSIFLGFTREAIASTPL